MHPIVLLPPPSHLAGRSNHYADPDGFMLDFEKAREGYESAIGVGYESPIGSRSVPQATKSRPTMTHRPAVRRVQQLDRVVTISSLAESDNVPDLPLLVRGAINLFDKNVVLPVFVT
jgi:hypothetical protein